MKEVTLHIADAKSLADLPPIQAKEKLVALFSKELDGFSEWLATSAPDLQQGALTKPERVLMLTYFMQKYAGNLDKE
jgi:hypothetical protein